MNVVLSEHLPLLATAPDGIQKLRGLILELAVRGKLVPQYPNDEPASELLKRIAKERAQSGNATTRKKKEHAPLEGGESPVSILAQGWDAAPLGEVIEIVRGITFPSSEKSKTPEHGRIRCLRTANVQDTIEWADILYIRSEFVSRDDQMLRPNDIVMSMANSRELVGKVALVEGQINEPATFGGFLGVLRPIMILPRFVMAFLRAPSVRASMIDSANQTTNIANISLAKLRPLAFPVPPLAEQHRIVAKVDELMPLCDRLEAEQIDADAAHAKLVETLLGTLTQSTDATDLAANWQRLAEHFDHLFTTESSLDALKQTILQLAVMGKLVPQDPNDEPASELLKRITKERAYLVSTGKLRKSSTVGHSLCNRYDSLPAGWLCTDIGSVAFVVTDGTHKTPKYCSSGIKFVSAKDIRTGRLLFDDCKFISLEEHTDLARRCKPEFGDILVSKSGSIGTVVRVEVQEEFSLFESLALIKFSDQQIDGDYLLIAIRNACNTLQEGDVKGVAVKHLHLNVVRSLNLALPPLAEQHRIVAKVDELMALCDRLKADLVESRCRQERLAATLIESALEAA